MGEYPHTAMRALSNLRPELWVWLYHQDFHRGEWVRAFAPLWDAQTEYVLTKPGEKPDGYPARNQVPRLA